MAVDLSVDCRNGMAQVIIDKLAVGTTNASPRMLVKDASNVTLATLTLSNPAFTAPSNATLTFGSVTGESNAPTAGTATRASFINRNAVEVMSMPVTITGGGGDVTINRTNIEVGDTVVLTSGTLTLN